MGRYIRKNPNGDEGQRNTSKQEEKVLKAWNRGERTAEEIAEITKLPMKTIYRYVPRNVMG